MRIPLLVITAVAVSLAFAASAEAASYLVDVPKTLKAPINKVAPKTDVPILLPSRLRVYDFGYKVYGSGGKTKDGYNFELGYGRHCGGANACFLAAFLAERGGTPSLRKTVALSGGITGHWKDITCGASCSPAMIEWVKDGVLYTIQSKGSMRGGVKKTLAALANSAMQYGERV